MNRALASSYYIAIIGYEDMYIMVLSDTKLRIALYGLLIQKQATNNKIWIQFLKIYIKLWKYLTLLIPRNDSENWMAIRSAIVEYSQILNIVNTFLDIDSSNTK